MSRLELVSRLMVSRAAEIWEALVTSRGKRVVFGRLVRADILVVLRAVAKTWKSRDWKFKARALPIPPSLQPVMRTNFFLVDMLNLGVSGKQKVKF